MKVGFVFVTATLATISAAVSEEVAKVDFGYPDVAAAMAGLRAKPGIKSSTRSGWTIFEDADARAVWSFPPQDHAAYPTAVRRRMVQKGDEVVIDMDVRCEAAKPACDAVVAEFERLNDKVRQELKR
ncbi:MULTISPECIES: hypothetical protein [unclassified Bradyrhizobium]|uniref:hypothetical protein n=1 Tax=unclassified Bradyrhizobium TaxID=2631580 RepID=UPI0028E3DFB0|nr:MULTISPECIES: hypothetical protein [unclassified Bradyrhizobium]